MFIDWMAYFIQFSGMMTVMNTMLEAIQIAIQSDCQGVPEFGEQLSDVLFELDKNQTEFSEIMLYSKTVGHRVVNCKYPPRWLTFRELKEISIKLNCNPAQGRRLIVAYTCALLRMKGFPHE